MRGKKTVINTIMSLIQELVSIACSLILPRLILSYYGSKYNGLINSITQFLSCAILLRSGIGGATRAALYKPLAENDKEKINSILKATDVFMKKIAIILLVTIFLGACVYPFFVSNEFNWNYTFLLFMIIGLSTFAESFFGITYLILLQADQKLWLACMIKSICYILNVVISSALIINGFSIIIVKLVSTLIFILYPIIQSWYVKKIYNVNTNVKPNNHAVSQRWDAFWHQVATFVTYNTDMMILTIFSNMLEVSVYSVYNLINNGLRSFILSFSNGLESAFGNMIARNEETALKENFSIMEFVVNSVATICYTSALVLIFPFVSIYTKNVTDVEYIRPLFAILILIAQYLNSIRIPYQLLVQASGHYRQTKPGAIFEVILNILISVVLVFYWGLIGVAIGTLISTAIRTIELSIYVSKIIIKRNKYIMFYNCLISFIEGVFSLYIINCLNFNNPNTYFGWIIESIIIVAITTIIVAIGGIIIYKKQFKILFKKIKNICFNYK